MSSIRSLVENKSNLDYKGLTLSLVQEFGIKDKVEWDSVIPAQVQKELFGGETLRLFKDHETFANQKDIRAIHRSKGETSQLLILSAILNDTKLSKQTIARITKKFVGGQAAERYVVWFLGNPQHSVFKVVLSGKEGKKVVLKTLPFAIDQPYYKTYDFILNEVSSKVSKFFVEPNELWKSLWKAFDISVVNKQFYNDIKTSFNDLVENVLAKSFIKDLGVKKHFAIRLLGRLIFCWFLKKKGIINDDVLSSNVVGKYTNYYKELLEKLFFDVFNTPVKERTKNLPDEIKDYPFLNGGLFEDQKEDYKDNYQLFLPNEWFYNLFNSTLEKYNFTIDENTSSNAEIAIDPEMLGRIFENLLAEQNPETKESARKSTGSYYTPREIVDYMVEQSLIEYLKSNINKDVIMNDQSAGLSTKANAAEASAKEKTKWSEESLSQKIEDFVHTEELPEELKPYTIEILDKLSSVKILDPACGSGAFPIGMLQKTIALKKDVLSFQQKRENTKSKSEEKEIYSLKLQTILNSIYGCDIQPMAVELSRLRCWLSLIIDEPVDKTKSNWGIENLPNLDFKFVCVNTLIGLPEFSASFGISEEEFNQLKSLREEYFTASAKRKEKIEEEFKIEQKKIAEKHAEWSTKNTEAVTMLTNWNPFDISETPWFDPFWMFGITEGFDITIANPPYIPIAKLSSEMRTELSKQSYTNFVKSADIYCVFFERAIGLLKENGFLVFISSNRFCFTNYGRVLREYLSNKSIISLININEINVFESANVGSLISLIQNNKINKNFIFINELTEELNIESFSDGHRLVQQSYFGKEPWNFGQNALQKLKQKIISNGIPFNQWKGIKVNRGITTGANKIFILDEPTKNRLILEDPKSAEIILPVLKGENIKRFYVEEPKQFIIFSYTDINITDYPAVFQYLKLHESELKEVYEAKKGTKQWYELRKCKYYDKFKKKKLVWTRLSEVNEFAISLNGEFSIDSSSFAVGNNLEYLSAILNSKVILFYFKLGSVIWGKNGIKWFGDHFDNIPIPSINVVQEKLFKSLVDLIITTKSQNPQTNTKELEDQIDIMVYKLYNLSYEEVKIIDSEIENIISKEEYDRFNITNKA